MSHTPWRLLPRLDQPRLGAARVQAHHAAQWLARFARAYVPAKPDDSHTNLGWDAALGGLATHALPDGTRLGLKIADLSLVELKSASSALRLDGRRDADARAWLGDRMNAHGRDARALDAPLPYPLPAQTIARGAAYATAGLTECLGELDDWFSNADAALDAVRREIAARGLEAPPVRCWPHHFDLDTLVTVAPGRTSGVGFAPGDEYYDEPYFYVSLYPAPDAATLPPLSAIGHWHTKNFTAAIAPAQRIVAAKDQGAEVGEFLRTAVGITIAALTRS